MFMGLFLHTEAHYKVSYLSEMELFWVKFIQVNNNGNHSKNTTSTMEWELGNKLQCLSMLIEH